MTYGHLLIIVAGIVVIALSITAVEYVKYEDCLTAQQKIAKANTDKGLPTYSLSWCR